MKLSLGKQLIATLLLFLLYPEFTYSQNQKQTINSEIKKVRTYISENWDGTVESNPVDKGDLFGLPKPYNVPTLHGEQLFKELYYWDTYFTNIGLLQDSHFEQAKNNVDDILFMVNRFGKMLNGSNKKYLNRSQPPYLSMMVADVYKHGKDKVWLKNAVEVLETEYLFWMNERITPCGLNRYSSSASDVEKIGMANHLKYRFKKPDILNGLSKDEIIIKGGHYTAEAESGWDFNPRFLNRCEDFCPIDLNSNLYLYEKNFAMFYKELGLKDKTNKWELLADKRKSLINQYCYDSTRNIFFDYDFVNAQKSPVISSAVFSLLFAKVVTKQQAKGIVQLLPLLETKYGLRTCENKTYQLNYQWGDANGWAPLHFLAIEGLKKYRFDSDANRIRNKYVSLVCSNFVKTKKIWEKYNIIDGTVNTSNEYKMPAFLGWTAGVFAFLTK